MFSTAYSMGSDNSIEEIRVVPLMPGACPVCATKHKKNAPHDRDSLYYQSRFYRKYRRIPTWEDAMAHCDEKTKASFRKKLTGKETEKQK